MSSPSPTPSESTPTWADNEWSQLREVIVGRLEGFCLPANHSAVRQSVPDALAQLLPTEGGTEPPAELVRLAQIELDAFIAILVREGVVVHRPSLPDSGLAMVETPHWKSTQMGTACVRDSVLIVGQHIIEAPMSWRCRRNETMPFAELFGQLLERKPDTKWISAPKQPLRDTLYEDDAIASSKLAINDTELAFEAADFIRCGRLILGQLSNGTNPKGVAWLRSYLGSDYEVLLLDQKAAKPLHIDCTVVPLGPTKILVNPAYTDVDQLPAFIREEWQIIVGPPPVVTPTTFSKYNMCSPNLAYNMLLISPTIAVVDETQAPLIELLEKEGIRVIPASCRYLSPFGGAFHCFTLDLVRKD